MLASNEIGTIQPIAQLSGFAHHHGIPFHTDAVAALGQIPVSFAELGVDAMSVAAHKIGGPLGVGALIARRDLHIEPLLHGGEHERGLRSGTVDVPGVAAFAAALAEVTANLDRFQTQTAQLRDQLINGVLETIPNAILSGPNPGGFDGRSLTLTAQPPSAQRTSAPSPMPPTVILWPRRSSAAAGGVSRPSGSAEPHRLPANASFIFPGADPDTLLFGLDNAGFAASIGAACAAGVARPSEALLACGFSENDAKSSLRFTLGAATSSNDIAQLLKILPSVVAAARR